MLNLNNIILEYKKLFWLSRIVLDYYLIAILFYLLAMLFPNPTYLTGQFGGFIFTLEYIGFLYLVPFRLVARLLTPILLLLEHVYSYWFLHIPTGTLSSSPLLV